MENSIIEISYSLDTLYFLVMGAFVMWMAAGFTMLESGLVRAKNTTEILTKNIALYSISCIMFMVVGYNLMYPSVGTGVIPELAFLLGADNTTEEVFQWIMNFLKGVCDEQNYITQIVEAIFIIQVWLTTSFKLYL